MTSCNHCWHQAAFTCSVYAGPNAEHIDEICCHCGQARCRTIVRDPGTTVGHGPYHPGRAGEVAANIRLIAGETVPTIPVVLRYTS